MKLDELRTVQSKERRKDSLQQLRDSFYQDVAAYIQDLKASRDRRATQVDDPFSDDEVRRMSDELETAEEVAEAVYERRVGKVVKLASFAAADMPVDDDGMTGEERELFDDLVDRIERNKHTVLDVLSGSGESTPAESTASTEPTPSESTTSTEPTPTESATSSKSTPTESVDTGDSGPIPTDPADSQPAPPSTPTEAVDPDGAEPSADNVLTEAMGAGSTTAQQSDDEHASTDATSEQVPPPEAEREPDIVETPTDGGTAAEAADTESTATEATESAITAETSSTNETPSTSKTPAAGETATTGETAETADGDTPATTSAGGNTPDDSDRTTLRITRDVGEIFGVDGREYTLRSEDIVTLPTTNAEPLVEQDAAMRVE